MDLAGGGVGALDSELDGLTQREVGGVDRDLDGELAQDDRGALVVGRHDGGLDGLPHVRAQQQRLDALSNDLANVNTTGYKRVRVAFRDLVYTMPPYVTGDDDVARICRAVCAAAKEG